MNKYGISAAEELRSFMLSKEEKEASYRIIRQMRNGVAKKSSKGDFNADVDIGPSFKSTCKKYSLKTSYKILTFACHVFIDMGYEVRVDINALTVRLRWGISISEPNLDLLSNVLLTSNVQ